MARNRKTPRQKHASVRTEAEVAMLRPKEKRVEYAVGCCRGLYRVVDSTGSTAWVIRYKLDRRSRRLTLEGVTTLSEAIKAAMAARAEVERGNDPAITKGIMKAAAAEEEAARKAKAGRMANTVDYWVAEFLAQYPKRPKRKDGRPWRDSYFKMTKRMFDRFVLHENGWSGRLIHEIRREDVNQLVREIAKETPMLAKRVYAALSVLFSWLREQKIIDTSPCNREPSKRYDAV
jgi:Arm DNA-binding domain